MDLRSPARGTTARRSSRAGRPVGRSPTPLARVGRHLPVFANVRVLADHQFALSWTAGSKLARREHATDLGPKRWLPFRIDSRGPALESFVDRITLRRKAGSLGNGRLLAGGWARNVSTAAPTDDRSILDLFGAVGTCTHGPLRLPRSSA